jgi:hypothetical protein
VVRLARAPAWLPNDVVATAACATSLPLPVPSPKEYDEAPLQLPADSCPRVSGPLRSAATVEEPFPKEYA